MMKSPDALMIARLRIRLRRKSPAWRKKPGFCLRGSILRLVAASLCIFAFSSFTAAADDPEVLVELARDRIYEGESVLYTVILNHVENPSPPRLEGFDDFDVQPAGEQSLNSQEIRIINGVRSEIRRYGRAYRYRLTPKRTGELIVPAPVAEVGGRVLKGRPLSLRVIAPQNQDRAVLEIRVDKNSVYPMQSFTVTLNVALKAFPEPYADQDPLVVLDALSRPSGFSMSFFDERRFDPPGLSIPWADDEQLPQGLEAERPWNRWLGGYLNQRGGGFRINNVGSRSRLSLFDDGPTVFAPEPQKTRRNDKSGKPAAYWEYAFGRTFHAKRVGTYAFGPVTLKGPFVTGVDTRGRLELDQVYAVAKPVRVTVKDVPLAGRPASYTGAIGRFQLEGQLAPTKAKVGDPMTFTLTLRGQGTLDAVTAPRLEDIPEIADHFRIHDATEESDDQMRRFTYSLRPEQAGIERFPPVEMSYFDVEQEQYVTLKTKEVPIEIGTAEKLSSREIAMASSPRSRRSDLEIRKGGLLANHTLAELRDDAVDPVRWFAGLGSLAGVYVIVVLVTQKVRQWVGDPDLVRRRTAAARARGRLRDALRRDAGAQAEVDSLRAAIVGLVADAAGIDEAGLTTGDVRERLVEMGVEESLVDRLTAWCEACDAARYGASAGAVQGLEAEAETLLGDLIDTFKNTKLLK